MLEESYKLTGNDQSTRTQFPRSHYTVSHNQLRPIDVRITAGVA